MSDHPLYPTDNDTYDPIHIYPTYKCSYCGVSSGDVEWREVQHVSSSVFIEEGTRITMRSEMEKLCSICYRRASERYAWA